MGSAANCSLEGAGGASFLPVRAPAVALEIWPHLGLRRLVRACPGHLGQPRVWLDPVPPSRRRRSVHLRRTAAGQGGKGLPLGNPGPWRMPTAGKAPSCGLPFTGREPHAIHGVTLPLTVILTVHRLHSTRHSARQTAADLGDPCIKPHRVCMALVGWLLSVSEAQRLPRKNV
jgi:hypothetical protein